METNICERGDHDWVDDKDNGDGTKWQVCINCGKRRRVSSDTMLK